LYLAEAIVQNQDTMNRRISPPGGFQKQKRRKSLDNAKLGRRLLLSSLLGFPVFDPILVNNASTPA
jgi:hypothetical protein